jgi:hypothetical protein
VCGEWERLDVSTRLDNRPRCYARKGREWIFRG